MRRWRRPTSTAPRAGCGWTGPRAPPHAGPRRRRHHRSTSSCCGAPRAAGSTPPAAPPAGAAAPTCAPARCPGLATPVAEADDGEVRTSRWRPLRPESTGLLLLGLVLAGLVAVGVVLVVLGARGLGLFDREGSAGALPAAGLLSVRSASASSTAAGADPAGAIDPDSSTAWVAGPRPAASGWSWSSRSPPGAARRGPHGRRRHGRRPRAPPGHRARGPHVPGRPARTWPAPSASRCPEPVVADRVRLTVGATYGDEPAARP